MSQGIYRLGLFIVACTCMGIICIVGIRAAVAISEHC